MYRYYASYRGAVLADGAVEGTLWKPCALHDDRLHDSSHSCNAYVNVSLIPKGHVQRHDSLDIR
jgi:hypothetical protein